MLEAEDSNPKPDFISVSKEEDITFFAQRLTRFTMLRFMRLSSERRRLVNWAAYSTFWDLKNLGADVVANDILNPEVATVKLVDVFRKSKTGG